MERQSARAILERLVAFPTVSSSSNLDIAEWIQAYLAALGVESSLEFDESGGKAGLCALIGPRVADGVALSGHTDVVPIDGQEWRTDPWKVVERDGCLYGRGTCDMKGFIAAVLSEVPSMLAAPMARPVQLAFSRDEEIGCLGAPGLIARMRRSLPPASAAIIGEPTMMRVASAHKGTLALTVRVRGREAHSSMMHKGVSAVMVAARLVDWANRRNAEIRRAAAAAPAAEFDPPYTTLHVGRIRGGTAQNIIARECRFELEVRCVPGDSTARWADRFRSYARRVEAGIRKRAPEAAIEIETWFDVPPLAPEQDGLAESIARRLTGDNGTHAMSYGTEAGQFQERGYSAVVCGPGDIREAHKPNEHISIAQLREAGAFVRGLIAELCG